MSNACRQLEQVFADCFMEQHKTLLKGGFAEPLYLPAQHNGFATIRYREDYFSSALHEVAHWCLAGEQRLRLVDYGYWYDSERNLEQQKKFESVEIRPQALEKIFTEACGRCFKVSADNLELPDYDPRDFTSKVENQAISFISGKSKMPARAASFLNALIKTYTPNA